MLFDDQKLDLFSALFWTKAEIIAAESAKHCQHSDSVFSNYAS